MARKKFSKLFFKINLIFFILLFLVSSVIALETNIKENYSPLETMILEIKGDFISNLELDKIQLYSGRRFIPFENYGLLRLENKYYFYSSLRATENNYTLFFRDVYYFEDNVEKFEDISFNFTVSGEKSDFSVKPGFKITNKDFELILKNNGNEITINSKLLDITQEIKLDYKQEKKVSFSIAGINESQITLLVLESKNTKYELPIAIYPEVKDKELDEIIENQTEEKEIKLIFSVFEDYLEKTITQKKESRENVSLLNTGEKILEDIEIIIIGNIAEVMYLESKFKKIELLNPGDFINIEFNFFSEEARNYSGEVVAISGNYSTSFLIDLFVLKEEEIIPPKPNDLDPYEVCRKSGLKKCSSEEECIGAILPISGFECCHGDCKKRELIIERGISGFQIFVIILVILSLIVIFFLYKKQKIKKKTGEDVIKERTEDYKKRFQPRSTFGRLSKS